MKDIIKFIKENKEQHIDLFKDIDSSEFKWQTVYSDDDYQNKCKKEVYDFANKLYTELKPYDRIEQLYKDSYKEYLKNNTNLKPNEIDKHYNENIKLIDKMGWGQLEDYSLEQGWWAFMYWVNNKYNK